MFSSPPSPFCLLVCHLCSPLSFPLVVTCLYFSLSVRFAIAMLMKCSALLFFERASCPQATSGFVFMLLQVLDPGLNLICKSNARCHGLKVPDCRVGICADVLCDNSVELARLISPALDTCAFLLVLSESPAGIRTLF